MQLKLAYVIVCLLADSTKSRTTYVYVVCDCGLSEMAQPTYKDLLDLLEQAESQTRSHLSTAELLTIKFSESYPHITISRPSRFLVWRTRPFAEGEGIWHSGIWMWKEFQRLSSAQSD